MSVRVTRDVVIVHLCKLLLVMKVPETPAEDGLDSEETSAESFITAVLNPPSPQ